MEHTDLLSQSYRMSGTGKPWAKHGMATFSLIAACRLPGLTLTLGPATLKGSVFYFLKKERMNKIYFLIYSVFSPETEMETALELSC